LYTIIYLYVSSKISPSNWSRLNIIVLILFASQITCGAVAFWTKCISRLRHVLVKVVSLSSASKRFLGVGFVRFSLFIIFSFLSFFYFWLIISFLYHFHTITKSLSMSTFTKHIKKKRHPEWSGRRLLFYLE